MRKLRLMPNPVANENGVCAGIAYWLGIPTGLVRAAFLLGLVFSGFSLLLYLILSATLNEWDEVPKDYETVTGS